MSSPRSCSSFSSQRLYNLQMLDRFLSFDVETTGFGHSARIVEIGCVLFEDGAPRDAWGTYLNPRGVDWNDPKVVEAMNVNKIDPAWCAKAPAFPEIFHRLYVYFRCPIWVAHNADFDRRMLDQEFRRYKGVDFPLEPRDAMLCTMRLSRAIHAREEGHKLENAAARWGIEQDVSHRAASDAMTCGRILSAMLLDHLPSDIGQVDALQKQAGGSRRSRAWQSP